MWISLEVWSQGVGEKVNKKLVHFDYSATNAVIYWSYLMATSDTCVKELNEDGDKSQ